ncbi:MAG: hypothetical protein AAGD06_19775 [Acidobacteriota bacterium]
MATHVSGKLKVTDRVTIESQPRTLEVLVMPLQTAISFELMVERSVEALRAFDGEELTLVGDLHGSLLASARVVEGEEPCSCEPGAGTPGDGTYRGRVESAGGDALEVDLRISRGSRVLSADFFRDSIYLASMRARLSEDGGVLRAESPRFIFDLDDASNVGGNLEVTPFGEQTVRVSCLLPSNLPETYRGEATFASESFRVLNIEVDKLDGLPWPPEYSTAHIPADRQPTDIGNRPVSLTSIFKDAGIEARVQHNDGSLPDFIGRRTGRPGEEDRWDEREMHEMMDTHYSRSLDAREWWLYLLIVSRFDGGPSFDRGSGQFRTGPDGEILNDGVGTTGIIFDHTTGNIADPWQPWFEWFQQNNPQFRHLFDFGREGSFANSRARQGAAVFWREMLDFVPAHEEEWYRDRQFLRTIVHELGHALNLAHSWLVGRPDTTSFMMYPHRYPHGGTQRVESYWKAFDYRFDPEEVFHCCHGFFNEVVPGGRQAFMEWTPSSVFRDPAAGGTRSNISLELTPTKHHFRFTEPVTVGVKLKSHSAETLPVGRLSPAYGDVRYAIRRPDGTTQNYVPPLYKCEVSKDLLEGRGERSHVTSLAVGSGGFVFDAPGRYEITAAIPDPSSGTLVLARPKAIWVGYPDHADEVIASKVFTRDAALFLYMTGGEHLTGGKKALEEVAAEHGEHPFGRHACLALGLNELRGQKRPLKNTVTKCKPGEARKYLEPVLGADSMPEPLKVRLKATLDHAEGKPKPKRARGRTKKKPS